MSLGRSVEAHISGRIVYLSPDSREVGREYFDLISQSGGLVLRAFCELDEIALTRDVTLLMNSDGRPLDGFCRIMRNGQRESVSWIDAGERAVSLAGRVGGAWSGPITQPLTEPLAYMGLHPLQGDALIAKVRGTAQPGNFIAVNSVTNSVSPDGNEAPGLRLIAIDVAFIGFETVTVRAGTFAAWRYKVRWHPTLPAADLWVRQHDCVLLKLEWAFVTTRPATNSPI